MNEFEDPTLKQLLARAGGNYPDVNVAYERLQARVRQARRRRAVVMSGVACSLLFATALVAINRTSEAPPSQIGDRDTLDATFPDDTIDDSVNDTVDTTDDTTDTTTDDSSVPATSRGGTAPDVTPASTPNSNGGGNNNGNGSNPTSSAPTTTVAPPTTSVFSGVGGSITIRLQAGTLTLISNNSTEGFSVDIQHSSGDRVEVRFESSNHRTRIRIDLKDGAIVPTIEENET